MQSNIRSPNSFNVKFSVFIKIIDTMEKNIRKKFSHTAAVSFWDLLQIIGNISKHTDLSLCRVAMLWKYLLPLKENDAKFTTTVSDLELCSIYYTHLERETWQVYHW